MVAETNTRIVCEVLAEDKLMTKILVRKDDPDYRIELVRWHKTVRGWFGLTNTMISNRCTPLIFPRDVWEEISNTGGTN